MQQQELLANIWFLLGHPGVMRVLKKIQTLLQVSVGPSVEVDVESDLFCRPESAFRTRRPGDPEASGGAPPQLRVVNQLSPF